MKRGTPRHPKVANLARRLNVEIWGAVGVLEILWQFVSEFAPHGDIGRHTDDAIAAAVGWRKKPEDLIQALAQARFLNEHETCRYFVHDWPDHCEYTVHNKIARECARFADGTRPKLQRLPRDEREQAERFYAVQVSAPETRAVRTPSAQGT